MARRRARDRDATERSLLEAAMRVLARDGFAALGPQAVAQEAGCDKKLVYRYFGSIDGLVAALAADLAVWLGGPAPAAPASAGYAERAEALLLGYAAGLRQDVAVQRILAAELAGPSPLLDDLEATRSRAFGRWAAAALEGVAAPAGVDAPAVNAVLLAAVHYLTLRAGSVGRFAGLELASAEGQARIDDALRFLLRRSYAPDGRGAEDAP